MSQLKPVRPWVIWMRRTCHVHEPGINSYKTETERYRTFSPVFNLQCFFKSETQAPFVSLKEELFKQSLCGEILQHISEFLQPRSLQNQTNHENESAKYLLRKQHLLLINSFSLQVNIFSREPMFSWNAKSIWGSESLNVLSYCWIAALEPVTLFGFVKKHVTSWRANETSQKTKSRISVPADFVILVFEDNLRIQFRALLFQKEMLEMTGSGVGKQLLFWMTGKRAVAHLNEVSVGSTEI